MAKNETGENEPVGVSSFLVILNPAARRTVTTLIGIGALIGVSIWLDARAKGYIESAARAVVQPTIEKVEAQSGRIDDHETRIRELKTTVDHIDANVTELLRRDNERVHHGH